MQLDRYGNGSRLGTWREKATMNVVQGANCYGDVSADTHDFHYNIASGILNATQSARPETHNYQGLKLLTANVGGTEEAFKNKNALKFQKYDNDTYYLDFTASPDYANANNLRFALELNGEKFLNACSEGTAVVTDQWQQGKFGDSSAKGVFSINTGNYYALVVKHVDGNTWKVAALSKNLAPTVTKQAPTLGSDFIIRQPVTVSVSDNANMACRLFAADGSGDGEEIMLGSSRTVELHGVYNNEKQNDAVVVKVKYGNDLEQYIKRALPAVQDVVEFSSNGGLNIHEDLLTINDGVKMYSANLNWNFTSSPSVLPSYYTLTAENDESQQPVRIDFPNLPIYMDFINNGYIRGGNTTSLPGTSGFEENDYRSFFIYNLLSETADAKGMYHLTFTLEPHYMLFMPTSVTGDGTKRMVTRTSSEILNPEALDLTQYKDVKGTPMSMSVIVDVNSVPTGVDKSLADNRNMIVVGGQGFVKVFGDDVEKVDVYTVGGMLIASKQGACEIPVAAGTYVVKVNNHPVKVVVR